LGSCRSRQGWSQDPVGGMLLFPRRWIERIESVLPQSRLPGSTLRLGNARQSCFVGYTQSTRTRSIASAVLRSGWALQGCYWRGLQAGAAEPPSRQRAVTGAAQKNASPVASSGCCSAPRSLPACCLRVWGSCRFHTRQAFARGRLRSPYVRVSVTFGRQHCRRRPGNRSSRGQSRRPGFVFQHSSLALPYRIYCWRIEPYSSWHSLGSAGSRGCKAALKRPRGRGFWPEK